MNTKILMTISSLISGAAGVLALFAPDALLAMLGEEGSRSLSLLVQLMGVLYFAFALMNWTAKDSAIGGIYARPVSLANFSHFFAGALILLKVGLFGEFNLPVFVVFLVYAVFAGLFYWLVFHATGIAPKK